MDIEGVITEQEYNSVRSLPYKDFTVYAMRFVKLCVEESLKTLPTVLDHLAKQATYLKGLSDTFYKDNKDLAEHKRLVAAVIEVTEANNPGLKYSEILKKVAPEARRRVSLLKETKDDARKPISDYDSKLGEL